MSPRPHIVITDTRHGLPYSKGLMASSLLVSGVGGPRAFEIAEEIEETLFTQGRFEVSATVLGEMAVERLAAIDERYANTYLQWQAVEDLDTNLIILIGGATGVGKSTIATQLAARLGITRVISTDSVREVLRSSVSAELMPTLYVSSFDAGDALQVPVPSGSDRLLIGFQRQVAAVAVGVKALISRAIEEGTDMIIEGAHLVPGFLDDSDEEFAGATLLPLVVSVSDEELHRAHFERRALDAGSRRHDTYLDSFDRIRAIQVHINQMAHVQGVPLIEAFDLDSTIQQVISLVVEKALTTQEEPNIRLDELESSASSTPSRRRSWQVLKGRRDRR